MLFIVIVLSIMCTIIYFIWNYYFIFPFRTMKSLPGPIRLPLIGSSYIFLQKGLFDAMYYLCKKFSSPFQIWIGSYLTIVIYEPNQVKTILKSRFCLNKHKIYKIYKPIFGTGLVTISGNIWVKNRRIIAPAFNASMLQNYFDTFVQESLTFIEELETINGNEVIFLEHIQKCTLRTSFEKRRLWRCKVMEFLIYRILYVEFWKSAFKLNLHFNIADTMFGIKMDTNTINETLKTVNSACNGIGYRFRNLIMSFDFPFNFTSIAQIQQNNIAFWKTLSDKIIQQWASKMNTTTANSDTAYNRFLDILMNSSHNKQFTQKDIHFNIITLLTGSYASTAVTINFATFMLANFSEIQEKVYKELLEIYGTKTPKDAPIKYEDLERMHYLTCVIKETLRLFPTFPLIGRYLETDLKIGNNIIPKGTNISISILQMHRDETYWPNPLKFDPERFLPQNLQNSELSCYMPFSSGPRNCIGEKYAMMGMKVILATLIRTFVFKVNEIIEIDKIKLNMNTELITLEPLKIIVKTRNL